MKAFIAYNEAKRIVKEPEVHLEVKESAVEGVL